VLRRFEAGKDVFVPLLLPIKPGLFLAQSLVMGNELVRERAVKMSRPIRESGFGMVELGLTLFVLILD
jgi:hypothetical protein